MSVSSAYARARQGMGRINVPQRRATQERRRVDRGTERLGVRLEDYTPDELPRDATGWTLVRNFRPSGGRMQRIAGDRYVAEQVESPPSMRVRSAAYTGRDALPYVVTLGVLNSNSNLRISVTDGATHTDLTPQAGGWVSVAPDEFGFSATVLNGRICIHQAESSSPYFFTPGATLTALPDWGASNTARVLRSHRSHLFALAIGDAAGETPNRLRWSDAADPGSIPASWTPEPGNEAGDRELGGSPGPIVDGLSLRDTFVVYQTGATHLFQFVGGTFVYRNRILFPTTGCLQKNCIAAVKGLHLVISDGDVVVHDGVRARSVVDGRLRRWLFRQIDSANVEQLRVQYYPTKDEVWLGIPDPGGEPDVGLAAIWDLKRDRWGVKDFGAQGKHPSIFIPAALVDTDRPADWTDPEAWSADPTTWAVEDRAFDGQLIGFQTDDGRFIGYDLETTGTETAILQRTGLDCGLPEQLKTLTRCYFRAEAGLVSGVQARLGAQAHDNAPVEWGSQVVVEPGSGRIDGFATGRLLAVEVTLPPDVAPEALADGFLLEYRIAGDA